MPEGDGAWPDFPRVLCQFRSIVIAAAAFAAAGKAVLARRLVAEDEHADDTVNSFDFGASKRPERGRGRCETLVKASQVPAQEAPW